MPKGRVRRRVIACARCRKRKLACDGQVPSCTRCADAGAPCVGFDSSTQREAPRSIAGFLEAHIANFENMAGPSVPSPPDSNGSGHIHPPEKGAIANPLVSQIMEDITPRFLGISKAKFILNCVFKGTQVLFKKVPSGGTDLDENHPRSIINPHPVALSWVTLRNIGLETATGLFQGFLDRALTLCPIYHSDELIAAFNSIYHPTPLSGQNTPRNQYIISLVMAISLSMGACAKQTIADSHAFSLVQHAVQWMPEIATNDVPGLQAILLLTQYLSLDPTMADMWLLTGMTSQAVIDLGLHQELPYDERISARERDMRRRVFWVAWEVEASVCAFFLRPMTLPTRPYDVGFPVEVNDTAITDRGIDFTGIVTKFACRRIWMFRQIEAEVVSVMHQNEEVPPMFNSLEEWMRWINHSITEWRQQILCDSAANTDPKLVSRWKELELYAEIATASIMVTLHRPSRRIPQPSSRDLLIAFANALSVGQGYWYQVNRFSGQIKYVFHPCHHSFDCALVFLLILRRCKVDISEKYQLSQIEEWMDRFSRFFKDNVKRWPSAACFSERYEQLMAQARQEYLDFLNNKAVLASNQHQDGNATIGPVATGQDQGSATREGIDEMFKFFQSFIVAPNATSPIDALASGICMPRSEDWHEEFRLYYVQKVAHLPLP
ncbi:hypothetical protein BU24DRAFT_456168 [Aaosphaeria arxii CBS 175.79]|uniref:Zn(2)-C6 fungal-type domain-containing protein n=1 Tax=Aaosphaeria arxii CBS 175.79 TaxID=1450172 RepID=A0A6A5X6V8_9PLEO|nr:uncharacterized protein BU24DRAFT_456168 [Aaosphaeria arxii CBS 175.79]KAF2008650.1 hypothetical protein BU24DRAFT_456168 [Aaosphaeria arxii CBS 175.79]